MIKEYTPLISVIVPIYNTEAYLSRCIESIQSQSLSELEIILVDDGSTDQSSSICEKYKKSDDRIILIHKENGGLSSARNVGLDTASSEYVGFVDSDDYIDRDMFKDLYEALQQYQADIAMCGVCDVYEKKTRVRTVKEEKYVLNNIDACQMVLEEKINSTIMPNKVFRKSLFDTVRFPLGKIMEDDFVCTKLFMQSVRVAVLTKAYYYYVHRPNSITTCRFQKADLDPIEAYDLNYALIKGAYSMLIPVMNFRKCWARFYALDKLYLSQEETNYRELEQELITYLRDNKKLILFSSFFSKIKKAGFLLLLIHPAFYKYFLYKRRGKL